MQFQARLHDDAERTFRTDKDLLQIRSDCRAGIVSNRHQRTIGQHDFHAIDHVLNLAVARRKLARAAAGYPAAHSADTERGRPMPHGHAKVALDHFLKNIAEHASFNFDDLAVRIEADKTV